MPFAYLIVSQTRTSPSLEELASRLEFPSKWSGSQARAVMNCLWPARVRPICFPVPGSHRATVPACNKKSKLELTPSITKGKTYG